MFTLFDLPESYEVPESERNRMLRRVKQFAQIPEGEWLNSINWQAVNLKWACRMNQKNGVMGCLFAAYKTIYLMPEDVYMSGKKSSWPELIVPTLIHELRHKWQYERNKLLYILCCVPVVREWTIEKDAWKITEIAQDFCDKLDAAEASAEYEFKQAKKKKYKRTSFP